MDVKVPLNRQVRVQGERLRLYERLLNDYRNVLQGDDNRAKRMTCTVNLLVSSLTISLNVYHTFVCLFTISCKATPVVCIVASFFTGWMYMYACYVRVSSSQLAIFRHSCSSVSSCSLYACMCTLVS